MTCLFRGAKVIKIKYIIQIPPPSHSVHRPLGLGASPCHKEGYISQDIAPAPRGACLGAEAIYNIWSRRGVYLSVFLGLG